MKRYANIEKLLKKMMGKNKIQHQKTFSNQEYQPFSINLKENEDTLRQLLGKNQDVIFTKFTIKLKNGDDLNAMIVAIDGLVNEKVKRNNILMPLQSEPLQSRPNENLDQIQNRLSVKQITVEKNLIKTVYLMLKSKILLLVDGIDKGLLINAEGFELRAIEEPSTEQAVRGAREGFIESTAVNLTFLRRRISHPALQFESINIGEISQTEVTFVYIKNIADPELVQRLRKRLNQIKVDAINSSGEIEQLIEDHPYSIFPTIGNTERPDKAAFLLMEGRILIFVENDPVSLYIPNQFLDTIKNVEDYNSRPYYSSFIRLMRLLAFILSITLPAFYISALNFEKALIPSDLIVPIIQAREQVPFPLMMEVLFMILMFEIVREAGVRLPQQIGAALSIVGALILGEVSVSAGLVGAPTIVVVSISYISEFVNTPIVDITALLRLGLFLASSIFGSYGLIVALLGLLTHLVSLTSLGVPYMAPFSPLYFRDWKDSFIRVPTRWLKERTKSIPNRRPTRIKSLPDTGDKQ